MKKELNDFLIELHEGISSNAKKCFLRELKFYPEHVLEIIKIRLPHWLAFALRDPEVVFDVKTKVSPEDVVKMLQSHYARELDEITDLHPSFIKWVIAIYDASSPEIKSNLVQRLKHTPETVMSTFSFEIEGWATQAKEKSHINVKISDKGKNSYELLTAFLKHFKPEMEKIS